MTRITHCRVKSNDDRGKNRTSYIEKTEVFAYQESGEPTKGMLWVQIMKNRVNIIQIIQQ